MSRYAAGRRFEWKVRDQLQDQGYFVIRSAGSKGAVDLAAFKKSDWLFVQCKRDGRFSIPEKQAFYRLAHQCAAKPIFAYALKGRVLMREVEAC